MIANSANCHKSAHQTCILTFHIPRNVERICEASKKYTNRFWTCSRLDHITVEKKACAIGIKEKLGSVSWYSFFKKHWPQWLCIRPCMYKQYWEALGLETNVETCPAHMHSVNKVDASTVAKAYQVQQLWRCTFVMPNKSPHCLTLVAQVPMVRALNRLHNTYVRACLQCQHTCHTAFKKCIFWSAESSCFVLERNAQSKTCDFFMMNYQMNTHTCWASLRWVTTQKLYPLHEVLCCIDMHTVMMRSKHHLAEMDWIIVNVLYDAASYAR